MFHGSGLLLQLMFVLSYGRLHTLQVENGGTSAESSGLQVKLLDRLEMDYLFKVNGYLATCHIGLAPKRGTDLLYFIQHGPEGQEPHTSLLTVRSEVDAQGLQSTDILGPVTPLTEENGTPFPLGSISPSGVEWDGEAGTLWWVNQRDEEGRSSLREMGTDGRLIRHVLSPSYHHPDARGDAQRIGVRPGLGYKGLTFHQSGETLFVVSEGPLVQDGDLPTHDTQAPVRITVFDLFRGQEKAPEPVVEYVYMLGPIPLGYDEISVADHLSLPVDNDRALFLETYRNSETGKFMSKLFVAQPITNLPEEIAFPTGLLSGGKQVPPTNSAGSGTVAASFNTRTMVLSWKITWENMSGPAVAMHFHGPADATENAGVQVDIGKHSGLTSPSVGSATLSPEQAEQLLAGLWFLNVHTAKHPPGEIRAQVELERMESVRGEVEGGRVIPVWKEEVMTLSEDQMGFPLDRLDYMALGNTLPDGRHTLFIGSNNENLPPPRFFQYLYFGLNCEFDNDG